MKKENNTTIIIILLILLLLFSFGWPLRSVGMRGMMFFPAFMILILVLIIWLIVSLTQNR